MRYFEVHHLESYWPGFLDDFQRHWPTDGDNTYVDIVRDSLRGNGAARLGSLRWRRQCHAMPRRHRNRRIGELLKVLDFTEGRSTGIPKVMEAMVNNGSLPAEFEFNEDCGSFMLRQERSDQSRGQSRGWSRR